jgi:hypothetical protein
MPNLKVFRYISNYTDPRDDVNQNYLGAKNAISS